MLISKAQPNLVGGVSQQPDSMRLESQCRLQENAYGTIVEGLKKRPPTKWVANLNADPADDYYGGNFHWVNRDSVERYLFGAVTTNVTDATLRAWDLAGNSVPIIDTGGPGPTSLILTYINPSAASLSDFRWTTINDYTFIVNTSIIPELDAGDMTPTQDKREAFIYVRQGNYKTTYTVDVLTASSTATASVSTWNGTTAGPTKEKWRIYVSPPSSGSRTYSVTILGYTASVTQSNTASSGQIAVALASQINNSSGAADGLDDLVTATSSLLNIYLDVEADVAGVSFTPVVSITGTGTGGTITATNIVQSSSLEYDSIKTDDIAEQIRTQINAVSGFSATRSGSVVRITHSSQDFINLKTSDSVGDTALKGYFLSVDNFDELPPRCNDGTVIQVQGGVEAAEDDFYVRFSTKVSGEFGLGEWREAPQPERTRTLRKMPLVLIRKQDDALGTATGTAFAPYFSLEEYPWDACLVGDSISNPPPTFVNKQITDIFFHKNRFGILTESSVVLSEAGVYTNFWRTTVRQLLDSDPIDLQGSYTSVSKFNRAFPMNERLLVFSDRNQFVVSGEPLLTPKSASIQFVSAYSVDVATQPVVVGKNAYFVANREQFASLYEYQQITDPSDTAAGSYLANSVSTQVPRYIPESIRTIAASATESVFALLSDNELSSLFIWKYFIDGDRVLQSAWSKFTFAGEVLAAEFYDNSLYLLTTGNGSVFDLEKIDFKFGTEVFSTVIEPMLDRQFVINTAWMSYNAGTNKTTITVPTGYYLPGTIPIITRPTGEVLAGTVMSANTVDVTGDVSAVTGMVFGYRYTMKYRFGQVDLREEAAQGGRVPVVSGRYQMLWGTLRYTNTNTFLVTTTILSETAKTITFLASKGNSGTGAVLLDQGEFRFPVFSKNDEVIVEISNNTTTPVTLIGAEWIAQFTTNFPRLR